MRNGILGTVAMPRGVRMCSGRGTAACRLQRTADSMTCTHSVTCHRLLSAVETGSVSELERGGDTDPWDPQDHASLLGPVRTSPRAHACLCLQRTADSMPYSAVTSHLPSTAVCYRNWSVEGTRTRGIHKSTPSPLGPVYRTSPRAQQFVCSMFDVVAV
jgi:hypothetical protein